MAAKCSWPQAILAASLSRSASSTCSWSQREVQLVGAIRVHHHPVRVLATQRRGHREPARQLGVQLHGRVSAPRRSGRAGYSARCCGRTSRRPAVSRRRRRGQPQQLSVGGRPRSCGRGCASTLSGSACGTISAIRLRVGACRGRLRTRATGPPFDDTPGVDHGHTVGHLLDHLHLVRDQHDDQAELAVDLTRGRAPSWPCGHR